MQMLYVYSDMNLCVVYTGAWMMAAKIAKKLIKRRKPKKKFQAVLRPQGAGTTAWGPEAALPPQYRATSAGYTAS